MADAAAIAAAVREAIPRAAFSLRPDVAAALESALASETSERGRRVLAMLLQNARVAEAEGVPLCQDTGTVRVKVELGAAERLTGDLRALVDAAVAEAYGSHALRASTVRDALEDRSNPGDNTPAYVELVSRPGFGATVHVMLKGGGSDNASALAMLDVSAGAEGVRAFVLDTVRAKGASACPPLIVGVGVGGTFDTVAALSSTALLREVGSRASGSAGELEAGILAAVNALGIGPGGFGGDTTALAVHVETAPCHIAALPVAVDLGCSAMRSVSVEVP
ncbi:MAG: fumarate hydratase [Coriobacteriaceae bacterium]|nr:fumarate hydratase [Coriobacteriaceae bacterium]